jgi:hypothetical protein
MMANSTRLKKLIFFLKKRKEKKRKHGISPCRVDYNEKSFSSLGSKSFPPSHPLSL